MLIEGDAKGLEVVCAAYLSGDKVLCEELHNKVDIHGDNQRTFGLPTRLISKTFLFRILYGGTEFGFIKDSDFNYISNKIDYWKEVISKFYEKYKGLEKWHLWLVKTAIDTGGYISPTGRRFSYKPYLNKQGEYQWPRTQILNFPVQSFGADLMSIARISAHRRLKQQVLFINSVHDSILVDSPDEIVYHVCPVLEDVFVDIPKNFRKIFNKAFDLPMTGEIKYGHDWKNMVEYKKP